MQRLNCLPTLVELHDLRASLLARLEPATEALNVAYRRDARSKERYTFGARVQQLATLLAEVEAALDWDSQRGARRD